MKNNNTESLEILQDLKPNGKERPWRPKKVRSLVIADSFKRLGEDRRAHWIRYCGTFLEFKTIIKTGERFLSKANFCRERLCPMCQWRRSLRVFYELSNVMDEVERRHKNLVPLFLTLTVRNCPADTAELAAALDRIFKGWKKLLDIRKVEAAVKGWFRALELTYNKKTDEFHPHVHALIFVEKSYFKDAYIETAEWVQLWKVALQLDYDPLCDIRRIRNNKARRKGIAEVAKYTVKDTDFATREEALTDHLVSVLSVGLKRRRLYAFGGLLKQIAAKFAEGLADEDLTDAGDGRIRGDVATMITRYRFRFGVMNYVREGGMKDEYPRDLTPEEIEDLRKSKKEAHEWFQRNYKDVVYPINEERDMFPEEPGEDNA